MFKKLFYLSLCLIGATVFGRPSSELRVLTLNTWHGGKQVDGGISKIASVIAETTPDVVVLQEIKSQDTVKKLLEALRKKGIKEYQGKWEAATVALLSRYPIKKITPLYTKANGVVTYKLTLPSGDALHVVAVHLDFKAFGLNLVRGYNGGAPPYPGWDILDKNNDGQPDRITDIKTILNYEATSQRDEQIASVVKYIRPLLQKKQNVIVAGDFNACSALDWTKEMKDAYGHNGLVIPWPYSRALMDVGMVDVYRALYPNPKTHPGKTWPADAWGKGSTSWAKKSDERDRIDFIYYHPQKGFKATHAFIVGSPEYWVGEKKVKMKSRDAFLAKDLPWPSDHKGVLAVFQLEN